MTKPSALERRYRRLLALYPTGFRRERDEEILAVLMAGAREPKLHRQLTSLASRPPWLR